jgi:cellulose synthase operon protein C
MGEISGCAAVRIDAVSKSPLCELPDDRTLRVWAPGPPGSFVFRDGPRSNPLSTTVLRAVEGGSVVRIVLNEASTELYFRSAEDTVDRILRLGRKSAPAWLDAAKAARQKGDPDGARAILERVESTTPSPVDRAFVLGLRGRLELASGRAEASFPLLRTSARIHREAGRISDAADDSFALAFALNQRSHRYGEARAVLDDVRSWVTPYADGRAREPYYRATLSMETGDARAAFTLLREARSKAARLGLSVLERNASNAEALQLELVGRSREARALLRDLEAKLATATDAAPCERLEIAINTSFGMLVQNEQSTTDLVEVDPSSHLESALANAESCKDRYLRAAALGNLALASLQRGGTSEAKAYLARAREGLTDARAVEVLFWHHLDGRIALRDGDHARALAAFDEELRLAQSTLSFEGQWRAELGRAEAMEQLGRSAEAVARYLAAEELLTAVSFLVPLGEGRGTFVGDRGRSARLLVDLLVKMNRPAEALTAARAARARLVFGLARVARVEASKDKERARWEQALGSYRDARAALDLEAKSDWKLSRTDAQRGRGSRETRETELRSALDLALAAFASDSSLERNVSGRRLRPIPNDALTVAFHPARSGWVGLVASAAAGQPAVKTFRIVRLPDLSDRAATASALLGPIRTELLQAKRLRVLAYGPLHAVDFHALPFEGQPLARKLPIEYPLDLPEGPSSNPALPARALVIADPSLNLSNARTEGDHVAAVLRVAGWEIDILRGREATSSALLPRLGKARLLHYAGHGVYEGLEGFRSALPLASGSHLTVGDLLASTGVPSHVVLSGCDAARSGDEVPAESLGLAQAFVLAGSEFVIAPVRPIDDALAARLSTALYGPLTAIGTVDAALTLREAEMPYIEGRVSGDWSAFRVVTR